MRLISDPPPLKSFLLAGAFLTASLCSGEVQAQRLRHSTVVPVHHPHPAAQADWFDNAQDIAGVPDDAIADYALASAETIHKIWHENAAEGKHTVVLVGENHTNMAHRFFQLLLNQNLLALMAPEDMVYTFEWSQAYEKDLPMIRQAASQDCERSLASKSGKALAHFPLSQKAYYGMSLVQSFMAGVEGRFVDLDYHKKYNIFSDSAEVENLQGSDFFQSLSLSTQDGFVAQDIRHAVRWQPTGLVLRDAMAAKNILEMAHEKDRPLLVVHSAGGCHVYDHYAPYRATLLTMLARQEGVEVVAFPLLTEGVSDGTYPEILDRVPHRAKWNYITRFSKQLFDGEDKEETAARWNRLCDRNNRPQYRMD